MTYLRSHLSTLILCLFLQTSCGLNNNADDITLRINFSKREAGKRLNKYIYLYDFDKRRITDSEIVKGETVVFHIKADTTFVAHEVALKYSDTFQNHPYLRLLGFASPYNKNNIFSSFYLDKGETVIKSFYQKDTTYQSGIRGSRQNEPFLKRYFLQFSGTNQPERSNAIINKNMAIIKRYSYSMYLLSQLFYNKNHFSNVDLANQLSCFNSDVQKTPLFKNFAGYLTNSSTYDKLYPSFIQLKDESGNNQNIGDEKAAFTLIVFWASWCAPCRKEIPALKELYKIYHSKGLDVISISLDEDKKNWKTALMQEKMPWQQLFVNDSNMKIINLHYDVKAIPKAYFFNKRKQLMQVYSGYNSSIKESIKSYMKE